MPDVVAVKVKAGGGQASEMDEGREPVGDVNEIRVDRPSHVAEPRPVHKPYPPDSALPQGRLEASQGVVVTPVHVATSVVCREDDQRVLPQSQGLE